MKTYLYREGDGNEGNYPRFYVTLAESDNPWSAIRAIMANRYTPNTKTRSHVMRESQSDGEPEYGILGTVYEGPKGETAFDAAWLTAELVPEEPNRSGLPAYDSLADAIDVYAMRFYRRLNGGQS